MSSLDIIQWPPQPEVLYGRLNRTAPIELACTFCTHSGQDFHKLLPILSELNTRALSMGTPAPYSLSNRIRLLDGCGGHCTPFHRFASLDAMKWREENIPLKEIDQTVEGGHL